uniref:Ycf36 n=1 Tax=Polysiphonia sertularioides TaxID=945028 RepID=A0A1Z1MGQ2_9FLOR|nr:hypothetical protein [Polysiphonia sertularioides]
MFTIKSHCPVPFEQQPINEYLILKKSWLFSWSISCKKDFVVGMLRFFLLFFPFLVFIIHLLMPIYNFIDVSLYSLILLNLILFTFLLRIYLGWSYVLKRLLSATIFYEESGWYDGQVWIKTSDYLMQDRLIGLYQIMPFILRIKYAFLATTLFFFLLSLIKIFG